MAFSTLLPVAATLLVDRYQFLPAMRVDSAQNVSEFVCLYVVVVVVVVVVCVCVVDVLK